MKTSKKSERRVHIPLKEDVFNHIDSVYRSARRSKNYAVALKALELYLKAKNLRGKTNNPLLHLQDLSDAELSEMIEIIQNKDETEGSF